jgi:hypothetical protein
MQTAFSADHTRTLSPTPRHLAPQGSQRPPGCCSAPRQSPAPAAASRSETGEPLPLFRARSMPPRHHHRRRRDASALVMAELAPQRFRFGIGASHQSAIEGVYGLDFAHPLARVREYIAVLRGLLWEGWVTCYGTYYRVHAELSARTAPPQVPLVLATLRTPILHLAGLP